MSQDKTLFHDELQLLSIQKGKTYEEAHRKRRGQIDKGIGHSNNHTLAKSYEIPFSVDSILQGLENAQHAAKLSRARSIDEGEEKEEILQEM